jgi:hypothetical protein
LLVPPPYETKEKMMRLHRVGKLALAVAAFLGAGALVSPVAGAAPATESSAASWYCPHHGECFAHVFSGTTLYLRSGGTRQLPPNDTVEVTCYYTGVHNVDPYWDHVVWENGIGSKVGHVADYDVNFNHYEPPNLPGHPLSHC